MKNITKGTEPRSLTAHRQQDPENYADYSGKEELAASLCAEQGGICCYCMGRIRPAFQRMKVEHWQSQKYFRSQRLVYANLLGACIGREGFRLKDQHCDTHKGDAELCRNPANPDHNVEAVIHYESDGTISSIDETFNDQLNTVLNLNLQFLKNNRKAVLDNFKTFLAMRSGKINKARWQKYLDEWEGRTSAGDLQPYACVVSYWIRKHLL